MSKIVKCLAGVASMAAVACGAYFVYKNVIAKEDEDFDFDDSFEEEDEEATREYVSIQITSDTDEEAAEEVVAEEEVAEETPAEETVAEEENVELEEVTAEEQ